MSISSTNIGIFFFFCTIVRENAKEFLTIYYLQTFIKKVRWYLQNSLIKHRIFIIKWISYEILYFKITVRYWNKLHAYSTILNYYISIQSENYTNVVNTVNIVNFVDKYIVNSNTQYITATYITTKIIKTVCVSMLSLYRMDVVFSVFFILTIA